MPIEIIAPTIVRFTFKHNEPGGHPADCILDLSVDEVGTTRHDAILDLVPNVSKAWQQNILGIVCSPIVYTGGHYIDLDSNTGISGDFGPTAGFPTAGSFGPQMAAPNVSYLVIKHCSHTRRQRAGRMFLPGVEETNVGTDGIIGSGALTSFNPKLASFLTALQNVGSLLHPATTAWRVVHVAGYDGIPVPGRPLGTPNAWNSTDVSSANVDPKVATQRRRLR